jgi:hypothetical protein
MNGLPALTLKAAQGAQIMNPFYWDFERGHPQLRQTLR